MGVQYRSKYTGQEIDALLDAVKEYLAGDSKFLEFQDRYNFPTIGTEGVLYIATNEFKSYIWDSEDKRYVALEPKIIYGGGAD